MKKKIILVIIFLLSIVIPVSAKELEKYNITEGLDLTNKLNLTSQNILLYNRDNKLLIYEKNSNEKVQIASLTKIMTAIIAIENESDLDKKVTLSYETFRGLEEYAQAGFRIGQEVSYKELLYGVMLPSGADAVNGIVINMGGKEEFIEKMNNKAKELKMSNTHFDNPIGMDSDDNYSTAQDIKTLLDYALNNKTFYEIFTTKEYAIDRLNLVFHSTIDSYSKNTTIDTSKILGAKSGFTDNAGLCLASLAKLYGKEYILINLNADYKNSRANAIKDASLIYDYFNENYSYKEIVKEKQVLHTIKNKFGYSKTYKIKSSENINKYLSNNINLEDIVISYKGKEEINYKTKVGDKLGTVFITLDNKELTSFDVYLTDKLKYYHPYLYAGIFLAFLLLLLILLKRKKRRKKRRKNRKRK